MRYGVANRQTLVRFMKKTAPASDREWWLYASIALAVVAVGHRIALHPSDALYSAYSDIFAYHYPIRHLLAESLRSWHGIPLWNPTAFAGSPLVGDPQAGLFYPLNWLHAFVAPERGLSLVGYGVLLHLVIGGWGMLFWLRGFDLSPLARLAGALAFVFCGKWLHHALVPGHVIFLPLAWVPWQLACIDHLFRRSGVRSACALALLGALMVLGAHPQLVFYAALFVGGYVLVRAADAGSGARRDPTALVLLALVLGSGLVAIHLLPVLDLLRGNEFLRVDALSYRLAATASMRPSALASLLMPGVEWETTAYFGVVATTLAVFGCFARRDRRLVWYCGAFIVFCLWLGLGRYGGLHRLLHEFVPGFGLFRIPSRGLLTVGVPLGLLAALGVEILCGEQPTRPRRLVAGLLLLVGAVVAATWRNTDAVLAAAGLCVPMLCQVSFQEARKTKLALAVVAFLLVDQARFTAPLIETRPAREVLPPNPIVDLVAAPIGTHRVLALNLDWPGTFTSLPITYSSPARLESLRGYNPLVPRRYFAYWMAGVGNRPAIDRYATTTIPDLQIASRELLDLLNTRWLITRRPVELPGVELRQVIPDLRIYDFSTVTDVPFTAPRTLLYENTQFLPRALVVPTAKRPEGPILEALRRIDPRTTVLVTSDDLVGSHGGPYPAVESERDLDEIRMSVDARDGGYLILSEIWFPGWRATDNGRELPVHRANGVFTLLALGPGTHEIVLRYLPRAYEIGRAISLGTAALTLVLWVSPRFVRRRRDAHGSSAR